MNDDQLRDRIGRTDPLAHSDPGGTSIDPITSHEARSLLEAVMNTPLTEDTTERPVAPVDDARATASGSRRWLALAGAAAAVAVLAVGAVAMTGGDDEPEVADPVPTQPDESSVLELSSGNDDSMASCMVVDATMIAQNPIAFKGTVTMADAGVVRLTVDEAYAGVTEQAVTLNAPEGMEALIGGVAWEIGAQYLVSAWDGTVNYCGQTGPATPELQAIYDDAFGR
ncbi:MAG: hypothetical protein R8G01_08315 [Ilumatobacteraceae bacterium]|nr:hypothetical protein [Ilumatobacteraceae bacterium]